jgi:hypothetical protein
MYGLKKWLHSQSLMLLLTHGQVVLISMQWLFDSQTLDFYEWNNFNYNLRQHEW